MAKRRVVFANGEYYHIFNRGIARQPTFFTKRDYERFLLTLSYYRFSEQPIKLSRFLQFSIKLRGEILQNITKPKEKLIEIICFILMPNHFHLILRQEKNKGVSTFMSKLINSYTRYVNIKTDRVGDLFQGVFKAVHVETDEQLVHLSRYIHLNPLVSYVVREADFLSYSWSSFAAYLKEDLTLVDYRPVLSNFKNPQSYKQFVLDHADYAKKLENIKHLILEG